VSRRWPALALVTGATGFLGRHVCEALTARGAAVRALTRRADAAIPAGTEPALVSGLDDAAGLRRALTGVETVVHLAAHVHQPHTADDEAAIRALNVDGTRLLLEAATAAGARDFAFASTVKVVGEGSEQVWSELTPPAPADAYGRTKLEAERLVREVSTRHGLHAPILRLPLVYGPGMKANALRLFQAVDLGLPLPFGAVDNRRSVLYAGNFVAALASAIEHEAGDDLFFVSDGPAVATPDLIRAIARALGKPARLIPVPVPALRALGRVGDVLARAVPFPLTSSVLDRLIGSLAVDSSKLQTRLGYLPPYTLEQGLERTAAWFRQGRARG
jgi:nucleoside-diphosphate-sugar epimerase